MTLFLKRALSGLTLLCFLSLGLSGQQIKRWTLKECIEYAINHNYQAAQNRLQLDRNKASLMQSKGNVLPSLNGSANHTYNTGRRIDLYTNQFANSVVLSQNLSLSGSLNLFSGLQNTHTIRAGQLAVKSSLAGNEQVNNDIALNIASSYLQVLLTEELSLVASAQVELSKQQAGRARILYESGKTAKGEMLQAEAQVANDELNLVNARNRFLQAKLSLAQSLTLESADEFEIEKPAHSENPPDLPPFNAREIYKAAAENFPAIKSAEWQYLSQERLLKAARAALSPSLSAFGGIGTGYSQLSRTQVGTSTQQQYIGEFQGSPIYVDVQIPVYEKTSFADQWSQNFNRTVGFSLNVPIFNNFRVRSQIASQKIALENARLQKLITRNNLMRDIQTAWLDAKASYEKYKAAEKNFSAQQESFQYVKDRYETGFINAFEFNTGNNLFYNSQSNLIQAKYEYVFRLRVLDYYMGKPIAF